ncbi:MAG: hypothetical protein LBU83_11050, partial [Bacteroidales bacterium]|nr:hypothetical protein [Bacteroidales bacterium]
FSKQTLLLASGKANSNITALMTKSFQQTSVNNYELNIEITTNNTPDNELWSMAFKIEKIDKEIESINLHIIYQDVSAFYIVGYDVNCGVEILGETAKAKGVYVFISENLKDTVAAFLPDNLFSFPIDIMPCCNIFGFNFFPQEYRFAYKVKMTFVPMTNEELQEAFCVAPTNRPQIYFFEPLYVVISSISKINKS